MAAKAKGHPGSNHIGRGGEGHPSEPWSLHQGLRPLPGKDMECEKEFYRGTMGSLHVLIGGGIVPAS